MLKKDLDKKKGTVKTVPCPSGNREHGWEGKMPPIFILSTIHPKIFNCKFFFFDYFK